jgi:hypothetical protein
VRAQTTDQVIRHEGRYRMRFFAEEEARRINGGRTPVRGHYTYVAEVRDLPETDGLFGKRYEVVVLQRVAVP